MDMVWGQRYYFVQYGMVQKDTLARGAKTSSFHLGGGLLHRGTGSLSY